MRAGGSDMGPVVMVDGSGLPTEGYAKIDLGRYTGAEAMGIRKEWWEGKLSGSRQRKSDGRIRGRGIGYGQRSCEWRTLWRENAGSVCWDRDGGRPGGRMIPCGGGTGGVVGQGRRRNLPQGEV